MLTTQVVSTLTTKTTTTKISTPAKTIVTLLKTIQPFSITTATSSTPTSTSSTPTSTSSTPTSTSPTPTSITLTPTSTSSTPTSTSSTPTLTSSTPTSTSSTHTTTTTSSTTTKKPRKKGLVLPIDTAEQFFHNTDDSCFQQRTSISIPFKDRMFNRFYVCTNGLVSFNNPYTSYNPPQGTLNSQLGNKYILMAYFLDLTTYHGGRVYYTMYEQFGDVPATATNVSTTVNNLVAQMNGNAKYKSRLIIKVTWVDVPTLRRTTGDKPVTFQLIITTDGCNTFTFYSYNDGGPFLVTPANIYIGYLAGTVATRKENNLDLTYLLNTEHLEDHDRLGFVAYQLTDIGADRNCNGYGMKCRVWHAQESQLKWNYHSISRRLPRCPCNPAMLSLDRRFRFVRWWRLGGASTFCTQSWPTWREWPYTQNCCYDLRTFSLITRGSKSGGLAKFSLRWWWRRELDPTDAFIKDVCCNKAGLCHLYYDVRPQSPCSNRIPVFIGGGQGDPHISTLDGREYTFNGHGEYIMAQAINGSGSQVFQLQARTDRAQTAKGEPTDATIYSGFAAEDASGAHVQVELNLNRTGMELHINHMDYTKDFYADEEYEFVDRSISIMRDGKTVQVSFSDEGISLNFTQGTGLLTVTATMPTAFEGNTKGLLGNFNENATDDIVTRNGTVYVYGGATEKEIFHVAKTWMTTAGESIFMYHAGKTLADYVFPEYVPRFLEDADPALIRDGTEICGAEAKECIFDYVFTGNEALAKETKATRDKETAVQARAEQVSPTLTAGTGFESDNITLYVTKNVEMTFTYTGSDDGNVTFSLPENTVQASINIEENTATVTFTLKEDVPRNISATVTDDTGLTAPALTPVIVYCSGCNGDHGNCTFETLRDDERVTELFQYATCDCTDYWTGDDCELDFDGCESQPCSLGRNCTDNSASQHENTSVAFTCTDCPTGYNLTDDGKCEDVDECTVSPCGQNCTNTEGSYRCSCATGYRLVDGTECRDIDECGEGLSDCQHTCTNTGGAYTCSCYPGYELNTDDNSCNQTEVPDVCSCSTTNGGCLVNSDNATECFCVSGYQLSADSSSCEDINECDANACPQGCSNSVGSYTCSCFTGFQLWTDGTACTVCHFPSYGLNCGSTCSCGSHSTRCDSIRGCVCKTGWTGESCITDVDECVDQTICNSDVNSLCVNSCGSYSCECRDGYQKDENGVCVDIDECSSDDLNGCQQECNNAVGGYSCSCNDGYKTSETNSSNCEDIDECTSGVTNCQQMCINSPGRYSCDCNLGYRLSSDRNTCLNIEDPCSSIQTTKTCSQICTVENKKAICLCNAGYKLGADEQTCIDIDECNNETLNQCTETCLNKDGGYTCSCSVGKKLQNDQRTCFPCDKFHYGDNCATPCECGPGASGCDPVAGCQCKSGWTGSKCDQDVNECEGSTRPCTGDNQGCVNTPGSYVCQCQAGYQNVSDVCSDIDECSSTTLNDCSHICNNTAGSYTCSCNQGYTKNNNLCNDIDECSSINDCAHSCENTNGGYRCSCNEGFKLDLTDRRSCLPEGQCTDQEERTCPARATCSSPPGGNVVCKCPAGFTKTDTECEDINECVQVPKVCGDSCLNKTGGYECGCSVAGTVLDTDLTTCKDCDEGKFGNNCTETCICYTTNTVSCEKTDGTCTCVTGWTGTNCGTDVNECDNSTACADISNSTCVNSNGAYACVCNKGYSKVGDGSCIECDSSHYGTDCSQVCTCNTTNTETCDKVTGTCTCKSNWKGTTCEEDVNECTDTPDICMDVLKTCTNSEGSYSCDCETGYSINDQLQCIDIEECLLGTSNCSQKCVNNVGGFQCACSPGFTGNGITCTECTEDTWGEDCNGICNCNTTNTIECAADLGCRCYGNWTGLTCSHDLDECSAVPYPCTQNSDCTNTQGSYQCGCQVGYVKDDNELCQACSGNKHGRDCSKHCDCVANNTKIPTQSCNHVDGVCDCKYTWKGTRCDTDVDECKEGTSLCNTKPNQGCVNTVGGFQCACLVGFVNDSNNDCVQDTATTPFYTTTDTTTTPVYTTTDTTTTPVYTTTDTTTTPVYTTTDTTTTPVYTTTDTTTTPVYTTTDTTTTPVYTTTAGSIMVSMVIRLAVPIGEYEFFNVTATYNSYHRLMLISLKDYYSAILKSNFRDIVLYNIAKGSLIGNYSVVLSDTQDSLTSFAQAVNDLASSASLDFDGEPTTVEEVSINDQSLGLGDSVSPSAIICQVYLASIGSCEEGYECLVRNAVPKCEPINRSDDLALAIGLGVGIPMFILAMVVAIVIVYIIRSKNRSKRHFSDTLDRSGQRFGFFPSVIPTKLNTWGRSRGGYAPQLWEEESASGSSSSDHRHTQRRTTRDFDNIQQGDMHNDDNNGMQSNFSWDVVYKHINPNEKYEIRRPQADLHPHPIFESDS